MKHLRMLGLAAVAAMALMAFFGSGSASGAVLCKTDTDPCEAGQDLAKGDTLTASLTAGTVATMKAVFSEIQCKKTTVEGKISSTGGSGKVLEGELTNLTSSECGCGPRTSHVTWTTLGTMTIDDAGTVTSYGSRFTIKCTGIASCIFGTVGGGGTDIGSFTDSTDTGSTAELDGSATLTWETGAGDSGQFVCAGFGDTGTWTASYQITSPDVLYLSTS